VLGVIEDVTRRTPIGFRAPGDVVFLLGETRDELGGSAWAGIVHDHLGGRPPLVDFAAEQRLAQVLVRASRRGVLSSAHDLADGGLAQALVESCLRRDHGVEVTLPNDLDPFVALCSESSGRALVSVKPGAVDDLVALCDEIGVQRHRLGTVREPGAEAALVVIDQFSLPLAELREAWSGTLRKVFAA
jgi:phosphoribosylformylglycinamidine synthase subunit PurL